MAPFRCPLCAAGIVRVASVEGMPRTIRPGVTVRVPAGVVAPRCDACGEVYLDEERSARVGAACEAAETK